MVFLSGFHHERRFWDVAGLSEAPLVATHSNAHALCPASRDLTDRQLDVISDSDGMVGVNFAVGFLREDGGEVEDTPLETVVRHVNYLVGRVGIDGAKVPKGIGDVSGLPAFLAALRAGGYDEEALEKLFHRNCIRVLRATWQG
jgi:membrane dipeptidase